MSVTLLARLHLLLGGAAILAGVAALGAAWFLLTGLGSTGGGAQAAVGVVALGSVVVGFVLIGVGAADLLLGRALDVSFPRAELAAAVLALPNVALALALLGAAGFAVSLAFG